MAGFRCPFCDEIMSVSMDTQTIYHFDFKNFGYTTKHSVPHLQLTMMRCPNEECKEITIFAKGMNGFAHNEEFQIYPQASYERYPNYIPEAIRSDYEEACKILNLSPKAAATLARRCLQGMIHDFWGIHGKNLNAEITMLKDKVTASQWKALDAVRKLGNIGAHMEHDVNLIVDIDSDEARKLILLIEHLIETWYIDRHESEELYAALELLGDEKTAARKG